MDPVEQNDSHILGLKKFADSQAPGHSKMLASWETPNATTVSTEALPTCSRKEVR
jgi:hypothetical protein